MLHKAAAAGVSMHGPSLPQPLALWVTPRPLMCTGKFGTEASVQVCLHWPRIGSSGPAAVLRLAPVRAVPHTPQQRNSFQVPLAVWPVSLCSALWWRGTHGSS